MNIKEAKTPPPLYAEVRVETAPCRKSEVGFTLQTLIVTAVLVLVAVAASLGLLAITSSSSDDFEEAGQTGVEARCAPNEIRDPDLEARGAKGINQTYREIQAETIGCNPICATWEYYDPGRAAAGAGGPEGNGGIYSTDTGCFAPCYWSYRYGDGVWRPHGGQAASADTFLEYFDDNRAPEIRQVRLGVNYRRSNTDPSTDATNPNFKVGRRQDLGPPGTARNKDKKYFILTRYDKRDRQDARADRREGAGSRLSPGTPMTPTLLEQMPPVFKPNFRSTLSDPAESSGDPKDRNPNNFWKDENWEYRADPVNKICTIVNITLDDKIVCSSEWDRCTPP